MSKPEFAHLHVHTDQSMLDGFGKNAEYIEVVKENGQRALGNADHGNLIGAYELIEKARAADIIPVPGLEAYLAPANPEGAKHKAPVFYGPGGKKAPKYDVSRNGAYLHQTIWAYNQTGLKNLFKLSSLGFKPENFYNAPRVDFEMMADHSEGLIVGSGCPSSEISTRFLLGQDKEAYEYAGRMKEVFGDRFFVEIMDHNMPIELERIILPKQVKLAKDLGLELLATSDAHYGRKGDAKHHEELLCVQSESRMSDKTIDEGGRRFAFSGEEYYLKTSEEMAKIFPEKDYPRALSNTILIAEMAQDLKLDFDPHLKPKPGTPDGLTELEYFKKLIFKGFKDRYGNSSDEVKSEAKRRIREELEVIHSSDFIGYFLVVMESIQWANENYSVKDPVTKETLMTAVGAGRGCFEPGARVVLEGGDAKLIEEISLGDKVITHDNTHQEVEKVFVYNVEKENMVKITLSNGVTIKSTADHMLYRKGSGFIQAKCFSNGDVLLGAKTITNKKAGTFLKTDDTGDFLMGPCFITFFPSYRQGGKEIACLSSEQLKALNILETDSNVESFDSLSPYSPYFEVTYRNGVKKIIGTSSPNKDSIDSESIIRDRRIFEEQGYSFEVWGEEDLTEDEHEQFEVVNVENYKYTGKVYDLQIANVHNYNVNGVTVHNSVGGSITAYLLGISEVDPIRDDLLFSRFLSAGRGATARITYTDGSIEDVIVSEEKKVAEDDGVAKKYVHQLEVGDEIVL